MRSVRARRDSWLYLTPEVERLFPGLLARVTAVSRTPLDPVAEQDLVEDVIVRGSASGWLEYLRRCARIALDEGAASHDPVSRRLMLELIADQYELAPAVVVLGDDDLETQRRVREDGAVTRATRDASRNGA